MPTSSADFVQRTHALKGELINQGARVLTMLEAAFGALFDRDAGRAKAAIALDDAIDAADVAIEQKSVEILTDATRSGAELAQRELRELLTVVKANNELERIADVAVDIAEVVPSIEKIAAPFPDTFRVLANSVLGILRDTNASLAHNNAELGSTVLRSQHAVWAFKTALMKEAEKRIALGTLHVDFAFHLHEVASLCELIADHCTNISEQVIYLNTGKIVRHLETSWVEVPRKN